MDNIVFDFQKIWNEIDVETGCRAATFSKQIRDMCRGIPQLEEAFVNIIKELDWGLYYDNHSYWWKWRSRDFNMQMWPKFGYCEERKKDFARQILEKFCPIASKYWIKQELLTEEMIRKESDKRTAQLNIALNNLH